MLLLIAAALVLLFSLLVTSIIAPKERSTAILSIYLLSFANIVLVGEAAGLVYQLNSQLFFLIGHALLVIAAGFFWFRAGRPALLGSLRLPKRVPTWGEWAALFKRWPGLSFLGVSVTLVYLFNAFLIIWFPPNTNDSMSTHMSRIGFWLQHGSFMPWPSPYIWQLIYPINAQTNMLWTILFWGRDTFAEFVQYAGGLSCIVAVFALARRLGFQRPQAFFASMMFATFPQVLLQSTTTQNDLVVAGIFLAAVVLLFAGLDQRRTALLIVSALGIGLALGTKQTVLFMLPGLAVSLLFVWIFRGKQIFPYLLKWGFAVIVAIGLVGSYMYGINFRLYGNPLGPKDIVSKNTGNLQPDMILQSAVINSSRLLYQSVDPTGLPDRVNELFVPARAAAGRVIFDTLNIPVEEPVFVFSNHRFKLDYRPLIHEDEAWFGPLGFLLLFPMTVIGFVKGIKRKEVYSIGLALFAALFLFCDAALRPGWDLFQSRYFIAAVGLITAYAGGIVSRNLIPRILRGLAIGLAIAVMLNVTVYNYGKPVLKDMVWKGDRTSLMVIQGGYMKGPVMMVESYVPEDAVLGLYSFKGYWDYPYFGEEFTRTIIPVYPYENIDNPQWIDEQKIQYLLFRNNPDEIVEKAENLELVTWIDGWELYKVTR